MAMAALIREGRRLGAAPFSSTNTLIAYRPSLVSHSEETSSRGVDYICTQVVRNQLKSVKNIQKIIKEMKMVAASKLRPVQGRNDNSRGLWQPTALLGGTPSVDVKKNVIITISSDKGLCGGTNSTSVKTSRNIHELNSGPEQESKYLILEEKAKAQLLRDSKKDIELVMTELQKNPLNYTQQNLGTKEELPMNTTKNGIAALPSYYRAHSFCFSQLSTRRPIFPSRLIATMATSGHTVSRDASSPECEATPRIKFKRLDKTAKHIMQILDKEAVEEVKTQREIPDIRPGYTLQLKVEVPENKRRLSIIKGTVIARRNAGLNTTFRIRRLVAGVGVESLYHLYSPNIKEVKVLDKKKVRRAKLYYLRDRMNALKKR
ncbi:unnamed protein product [Cuscuta europaea]|uniref:Uncharacterized protein n=1 Tax=Cuscuta europaea TaxID=41803 RepID=A0A9P0ZYE5_CUSEU|nr:unnamed protein product [Cuscuta europaea]